MFKILAFIGVFSSLSLGWCQDMSLPIIKTLQDIGRQSVDTMHKLNPSQTLSALVNLDKQDVLAAIKDYLHQKFEEEYEIYIDSPLMIPGELADQSRHFTLEDGHINEARSIFTAQIVFGESSYRHPLKVRLERLIDIPVLSHPVKMGETIGENDLVLKRMSARRVRSNVLTRIEDIVGHQPRNLSLAADDPLRKHDLIKPQAVKRGAFVTVSVDSPGLSIQMQAKALDSGAIGEEVRVVNTDSNKILKGIIEGPDVIKIRTISTYAAAMGDRHDVR